MLVSSAVYRSACHFPQAIPGQQENGHAAEYLNCILANTPSAGTGAAIAQRNVSCLVTTPSWLLLVLDVIRS